MPHIVQCPFCNINIEYVSSKIGEMVRCSKCGYQVQLSVPEKIQNPKVYNLPEKIEIRICNKMGIPMEAKNILISIERGYVAGPFFTNGNGIIQITKKMLKEAQEDWISSGGGDYRNFNLISHLTVSILSIDAIERWVKAREETWNFLSEYEKKYWQNINALIFAMRSSVNYKVKSVDSSMSLKNFIGNERIIHLVKTVRINGNGINGDGSI